MDNFAQAQQLIQQNNSWSAAQAQKQMDFQAEMSNTAHQREIADLKASGLNPVLSAKLGGASTPSGAMGDTDTSGTSVLIDALLSAVQAAGSGAAAAESAVDSYGSKTVTDSDGNVVWTPFGANVAKRINAAINASNLPYSLKHLVKGITSVQYVDKPKFGKFFNWLNNTSSYDPFGAGYFIMPKAARHGDSSFFNWRYK